MSRYQKKDPQTLLGDDQDRKTPQHDAIMMWLDGYVSRPEFLTHFTKRGDVDGGVYPDGTEGLLERKAKLVKVWEKPLITGPNKYTVAFVDLFVEVWVRDRVKLTPEEIEHNKRDRIFPVDQATESHCLARIAFEVKSRIDSLGAVVRQIRLMEQHVCRHEHWRFSVVSPDDRFAETLRAQGIAFLKAPEPKL